MTAFPSLNFKIIYKFETLRTVPKIIYKFETLHTVPKVSRNSALVKCEMCCTQIENQSTVRGSNIRTVHIFKVEQYSILIFF